MKIVFALHYAANEREFGRSDGGTAYGNRLLDHVIKLRRRLEATGAMVATRSDAPMSEADVAIFGDLDPELWSIALALPPRIPCVLICTESPVYTPMSHQPEFLFHPRWSRVLTWNRSYEGARITHYDIATAGARPEDLERLEIPTPPPRKPRGVVVTTRKSRQRGLVPLYNRLCLELAGEGLVDIYGAGWPVEPAEGLCGPTGDKIATLRQYEFTLLSENSLHPGYVTEKLPDSIIAGTPAIYRGDVTCAERRFPGTFIPLEDLSRRGFDRALTRLRDERGRMIENIRASARASGDWDESFVGSLVGVVEHLAGRA
jgi:hypothetical protein